MKKLDKVTARVGVEILPSRFMLRSNASFKKIAKENELTLNILTT